MKWNESNNFICWQTSLYGQKPLAIPEIQKRTELHIKKQTQHTKIGCQYLIRREKVTRIWFWQQQQNTKMTSFEIEKMGLIKSLILNLPSYFFFVYSLLSENCSGQISVHGIFMTAIVPNYLSYWSERVFRHPSGFDCTKTQLCLLRLLGIHEKLQAKEWTNNEYSLRGMILWKRRNKMRISHAKVKAKVN